MMTNFGFGPFVFLVCSISTERYTGTIIEQDTQQAVPCDIYILRFEPDACYILVQ